MSREMPMRQMVRQMQRQMLSEIDQLRKERDGALDELERLQAVADAARDLEAAVDVARLLGAIALLVADERRLAPDSYFDELLDRAMEFYARLAGKSHPGGGPVTDSEELPGSEIEWCQLTLKLTAEIARLQAVADAAQEVDRFLDDEVLDDETRSALALTPGLHGALIRLSEAVFAYESADIGPIMGADRRSLPEGHVWFDGQEQIVVRAEKANTYRLVLADPAPVTEGPILRPSRVNVTMPDGSIVTVRRMRTEDGPAPVPPGALTPRRTSPEKVGADPAPVTEGEA